MRLKVVPICPACRAPHDREVDPGIMITCPDCDEHYRAEAPEPSDAVDGPRDRTPSGKAARTDDKPAEKKKPKPAKKPDAEKKPRAKKGDKLGKLIERFSPSQNRAALLTIAIGAGVAGLITGIVALAAVDRDIRPYVLGAGGVLWFVAAVCLLMLKFGGSNAYFDVFKKGVRYKNGRTDQWLYWEEMESVDIRRVILPPGRHGGKVKYEILLVGSETIHLTNAFLSRLDNPSALIKALKRHSGKDFETAYG
jgi:hypothetical protein